MKPALLTLALLLLAGCDRSPSREANTADAPAAAAPSSGNLAVPIEQTAPASGPSPTAQPKAPPVQDNALVSRETSNPSATAAVPPPPPEANNYRAMGAEPFWAATVHDSFIALEPPSGEPLRFAVVRQSEARTIRYAGEGFTMTVTPGPCSDGMSEALWSDRVQVAFAGGVLKGCGGVREDMEESPDDN